MATNGINNLGNITACGVSLQTFYFLTVAGITYNANTSEYITEGGKYDNVIINNPGPSVLHTYQSFNSNFRKHVFLDFYYPLNFLFNAPISVTSNVSNIRYKGLNGTTDTFVVSLTPLNLPAKTINFTEYGPVGLFISGNLNGSFQRTRTLPNSISINDTINATFNFRVKHVSLPTSY